MVLVPEWKRNVTNNLRALFLDPRKDSKLTVRHLLGAFLVTNGTNTETYS